MEKKDSNIHNNQTAFADCLDHSIAMACQAIAKHLKNLLLALAVYW